MFSVALSKTLCTLRMISQQLFRALFFVLPGTIVLLFLGCAGQLPPPGGPPDTTPPEVVRTSPPNYSTNIDTKYLELEFSELVDRRSVQESIFISPPVGTLDFDWSGRRVKINFGESLNQNTTYVVNIGTDVVDTRAGNRMAVAYTLAFSTGDVIDPGVIEGRVYDDMPEGLMVFGYRLDRILPDTLNPSVSRPDYVTQTGKSGVFSLDFLSLESYRLYVVRDEYRNLLYDPEVDAYGVLQVDVTLTSLQPMVTGVRFRLAKEDTSGPILVSVKSPDRSHLEIRFSEPVHLATSWHRAISIIDTLKGRPVRILSVFPHSQNPEVITVVTSNQDSSAMYRVMILDAFDQEGNPMRAEARTRLFQASDSLDRRAPTILYTSMRDSAMNVPLSEAVELQFEDAVKRHLVERSLVIEDSAGVAVPGRVHWVSDASVQYQPIPKWKRKMWYTVSLEMDSLVDLNGNRGRDSTWTLRFETMDDKLLGSIEGSVTDTHKDRAKGTLILTARAVNSVMQESYTIRRTGSGGFRFVDVAESKYVIEAYRDEDENQLYSFGRPFPFRPSERFTVYPDTVKVRARWPVEGVSIVLD